MDAKIIEKLDAMVLRKEALTHEISQPETMTKLDLLRELSQELSALDKVLKDYNDYQQQKQYADEALQMTHNEQGEMRDLALQEFNQANERCEELTEILRRKLLANDDTEHDKNVYLEIRAGTGGDEAALFATDLLRMYTRYAEQRNWKTEIVSSTPGSIGGYKSVVVYMTGKEVYGILRFESGVHRVQRVPETESQGRIHTSACTVAVLPEAKEMELPELDKTDLRIDTYRASGAGGQHVNKTDSAVRITHLPTSISVECQQERSQLQNKLRAMTLLKTLLLDKLKQEQEEALSAERRSLIGSGDRSEKIRTYNFPQGRVTDHRVKLTLHNLQGILDGDIEALSTTLQRRHEEQLLNAPSP
jgi:peptide chain release factor 1